MPKSNKLHLGQRLKEAIKLKGCSQADVAREFNVKPPTVSGDWIKNGTIDKGHYSHLVEFFQLPYAWWFGETSLSPKHKPVDSVGEVVLIDWYRERKFAAGSGIHIEEDGDVSGLAFRQDWLRHKGLNARNAAAVSADGPSMHPHIEHADLLLLNTSQTDILNGKIYAFIQGRKGRVKRLYRTTGGALRIVSDNPEFKEEILEPEKHENVSIIGRVVWIARNV